MAGELADGEAVTPYYEEAGITIYHGDCREIAPALGLSFATVSDPPYGIAYRHSGGGRGLHDGRILEAITGDEAPFDPSPWLAYQRVLLWGADHFAASLPMDRGCWIAWDKAHAGGPADYFSDAEFAWSSVRTPRNALRVQWKGIANVKRGEPPPRRHPAPKPGRPLRARPQNGGGAS